MKNRIYICICCAVIIVFTAAVYAMKMYEISFDNHIRTGSVDIRIEQYEMCAGGEKLIEPGVVMPNQDVSYIPKVTNLRSDGYVRVKVELAMDKSIPRPLTLEDVYKINEDWVQKGEFFYNTKVMKKGETSVLFRGFHVPEEWTQETASGFNFTVTADVIQNDNFTPDFDSVSPWGSIEIEQAKVEDNIVYGIAERKAPSPVFEYTSAAGLSSEYTDLFSNFSCFMAGDCCSDTLIMKNKSDSDIRVYFSTQAVNDDMLRKMRLSIKCGGRKVYEGNLAAESLKEYEELTVIDSKTDGVLDFEVKLPEDSGNYYSVLKDKVIWKFRVEEIGDSSNVKTGDGGSYMIAVIAMLMSAGAFAGTVLLKRKRNNEKSG